MGTQRSQSYLQSHTRCPQPRPSSVYQQASCPAHIRSFTVYHAVWGVEPVVTHETPWLESTVVCGVQQNQANTPCTPQGTAKQRQDYMLLGTDQILPLQEVQIARVTASIRQHQEVDICMVTTMHLYKKRATKQGLLRWVCWHVCKGADFVPPQQSHTQTMTAAR